VVVEERERMSQINRDAVDVRFKLRSPSKIAFDMNAGSFDKKIKTCLC
jgi:hypothetical protein